MTKLSRIRPFRVKPKLIYPILAGYCGLDGGIGISWLGYLFKIILPKSERLWSLGDRFAHAAGALSDIQILVTSCVSGDASREMHELAEGILRRILSSAHEEHHPPSWFIHEWEKRLWDDFERGDIRICGNGFGYPDGGEYGMAHR